LDYFGVHYSEYGDFMRKLTANRGAAEERRLILRKMNQLEKSGAPWAIRWNELRVYIKGMAVRASRKRGGLGRK